LSPGIVPASRSASSCRWVSFLDLRTRSGLWIRQFKRVGLMASKKRVGNPPASAGGLADAAFTSISQEAMKGVLDLILIVANDTHVQCGRVPIGGNLFP
jgi:hypothetical protein